MVNIFLCLSSRNELIEEVILDELGEPLPPYDVFDLVLPAVMPYDYVLDADGTVELRDFREAFLYSMTARFQDRVLNTCPKYWVNKYRAFFTSNWVATVGKKYSIWQQNHELDINYANLTETITNEHTEPVRNASANDTPSTKDVMTRRFIQPSGPLGAANIIKDSMDSIDHPFTQELDKMEKWFVNEKIMEWRRC